MAEAIVEQHLSGKMQQKTNLELKPPRVDLDPDAGFVEKRPVRQQWVEYALMCLCNVAWTIDYALLPTFFTEFQVRFDASQTSLSMLTTTKGVVAALFAFPAGFVGELLPRPQLIGLGMVFWSLGLVLCSMAWSLEVLLLGRIFNGMGIGMVQPLLLSLVADQTQPTKRGFAFGSVYFTGAVCNSVFTQVATAYAATIVFGVEGWRISIAGVAAFSVLVGAAIMLIVEEPNAAELAERRKHQGFASVFVNNLPKVWSLFRYPTFVLIICQGAPGSAPWTVFPFMTQWLELSCFTHEQAATIFAGFNWGVAVCSLLIGVLLNFVARRFPDHGPPALANFSVASGIPFLGLIFFLLPKPMGLGEGSNQVAVYLMNFLSFGLLAGWCGAINKKVFADIVPSSIYTYVFAVDQLIENILGSLAPLSVGMLTDKVFHYNKDAVSSGGCAPDEADKLGLGMFVVCTAAWTICFFVYVGMHCTYPADRQRALMQQAGKAVEDGGKNDKQAASSPGCAV
mmetsp:Transcript_109420/g.282854  ORF Transcript_109420/g.282854 Transcript_109420/m.282854 type:complete len:511 (+) Transcript_109420:111-1643(+)